MDIWVVSRFYYNEAAMNILEHVLHWAYIPISLGHKLKVELPSHRVGIYLTLIGTA